MKIEHIIYETARELFNVEDKIRIATIFIFCYQKGTFDFSDLLYCEDKEAFIESLNQKYKEYEVDFSLNLKDKNINSAFYKTIEKVKQVFDKDGFHKAIFDKDEYALVIANITKNNIFSNKFREE